MLVVKGTFEDGKIILHQKVECSGKVDVLVTFLENDASRPKTLLLDNFSFGKSQELLKDYQGSLSDAIVEERRRAQ